MNDEKIEASVWLTTDDLSIQADVTATVDRGYTPTDRGVLLDVVITDICVLRVLSVEMINRARDRRHKPAIVLEWTGPADRAAMLEAVQFLADEQQDSVIRQLAEVVPTRGIYERSGDDRTRI